MWSELLDNLRAEAASADTPAERVRLRKEIGALYAKRLEDPNSALEAYRSVLDEAPSDEDAVAAVTLIGETREELSLMAADILEPVLRQSSQFEKLVKTLELRVRAQTDPADRAATLKATAKVLGRIPLPRRRRAVGSHSSARRDARRRRPLHRDRPAIRGVRWLRPIRRRARGARRGDLRCGRCTRPLATSRQDRRGRARRPPPRHQRVRQGRRASR